ncbi:DNA repair and recombination protein rad54b [Homalodisca vitripennis]|nr:DNA repair and recombination protein rad54b [Homalodisca vitripennis]
MFPMIAGCQACTPLKCHLLSDYLLESLCEELSRLSGDQVVIEDATKLLVVTALLHSVAQAKERIVLVSYFTQTLDLLAALCDQYHYKHCRLDGSTPTARRVEIVNKFNSPYSENSVFLLSARAGGVGLNLTGASRLVLFDSDWNPASDLQAMARVWRDGQKNSVHIYSCGGFIQSYLHWGKRSVLHWYGSTVNVIYNDLSVIGALSSLHTTKLVSRINITSL